LDEVHVNGVEDLAVCAGSWRGSNVLEDPHSGRPEESAATATVTPLLGGRFARIDYTWGYQGKPQEGSLLLGPDEETGVVRGYWFDSWHQSGKIMLFEGPKPSGEPLSLRGSYPAPPGPDWGWRIELSPSGSRLVMRMFNVTPDGQEQRAVEAAFSRP
jgi:hypothetical protein